MQKSGFVRLVATIGYDAREVKADSSNQQMAGYTLQTCMRETCIPMSVNKQYMYRFMEKS